MAGRGECKRQRQPCPFTTLLTRMRLVLERMLPPRKDRPVTFALPKLETAADAVKAAAALAEAVATGDLTPNEAGKLAKLVEGFTKAFSSTKLSSA